jgi:hypothetical protein
MSQPRRTATFHRGIKPRCPSASKLANQWKPTFPLKCGLLLFCPPPTPMIVCTSFTFWPLRQFETFTVTKFGRFAEGESAFLKTSAPFRLYHSQSEAFVHASCDAEKDRTQPEGRNVRQSTQLALHETALFIADCLPRRGEASEAYRTLPAISSRFPLTSHT